MLGLLGGKTIFQYGKIRFLVRKARFSLPNRTKHVRPSRDQVVRNVKTTTQSNETKGFGDLRKTK